MQAGGNPDGLLDNDAQADPFPGVFSGGDYLLLDLSKVQPSPAPGTAASP